MYPSVHPALASPIVPMKGACVLPQGGDTFEAYSPYDTENQSWAGIGFSQEGADFGVPQALYDTAEQEYEQAYNNNQSTEELPNLTYNGAVDPDSLSRSQEYPETTEQSRDSGLAKSNLQKNFVRKLYEMLEDKAAQRYIRWLPDGKSFVIENQEEFAKNVLPRYLKTEQFQSFIRQLNMYDFHKTNKAQRSQRGFQTQAPQYVFSHAKFRRGHPGLLAEIKRKGAEQQDPPAYADALMASASIIPGQLNLPLPQPDHQKMFILQVENSRLKTKVAQLQAANAQLTFENSTLKSSLRLNTLPRPQNEVSTLDSSLESLCHGTTPHQSSDLTDNINLFSFNYSDPQPTQADVASVLSQLTGNTTQNASNQACFRLDSTSNGGPSSSTRSPVTNTIAPSSPQQFRSRSKPRPTSWYNDAISTIQHLIPIPSIPSIPLFQADGINCEAGPSNYRQDTYAPSGTTHGRTHPGSRSATVIKVAGSQQPNRH